MAVRAGARPTGWSWWVLPIGAMPADRTWRVVIFISFPMPVPVPAIRARAWPASWAGWILPIGAAPAYGAGRIVIAVMGKSRRRQQAAQSSQRDDAPENNEDFVVHDNDSFPVLFGQRMTGRKVPH